MLRAWSFSCCSFHVREGAPAGDPHEADEGGYGRADIVPTPRRAAKVPVAEGGGAGSAVRDALAQSGEHSPGAEEAAQSYQDPELAAYAWAVAEIQVRRPWVPTQRNNVWIRCLILFGCESC